MKENQVWVTAAVDESTATKALALGYSIRRSVSSRKLAVVVCHPVSDKTRKLLSHAFHQVIPMDKLAYAKTEMNGLPMLFHCKLLCWGLPFVEKVVFLYPNEFVVKNADELFEIQGQGNIGFGEDGYGSATVIRPDLTLFEDMLRAVRDGQIHSGDLIKAEQELSQWLSNRGILTLLNETKFCVPISATSVSAHHAKDLRICRFIDWHPLDFYKGNQVINGPFGLLEQALLDHCNFVFAEDVLPNLTATNGFISPALALLDFTGVEEPIAIVGMSCRFPGANSVDEYWQLLIEGRDCICKVPDHRWPSGKSADFREVQAGFLKCPVDTFDGKFFGISPADLLNTDPQQRLLMEVVWEALEDAALDPQKLKGTPGGVFAGSWTTDYRDLLYAGEGIDNELGEFHRMYMGNSLGGTGGRLSYILGLTGPNVATESGCSSGMVAIYLAVESLRAGRCKVAIAGGVNLLLHPFMKKHMQSIVAPDGKCKTFDEKADGFGRGEGVASLILKRYSDAVKDGDRIHALIRGAAISQEGTSRSFGTPTKECQELAMKTALENAGIEPHEVSYVEAHGTGTMVGDPVEMAAITAVYSKGRTRPLVIASGKTNIGHTESCSGFAGIIKAVLAMRYGVIPPHLNLNTINPHINLDAIPAVIPQTPMEWNVPQGTPRYVGVSSFGITGTDAHLILQEAPNYSPAPLKVGLQRPLHLLTLSSKSEQGLEDVVAQYGTYLEQSQTNDLADVAFTANTGRAHFPYRTTIVARNNADALKKLRSATNEAKKHIPEQKPRICFLFTGQGSQYEGMAKTLYDTSPTFRMHFDQCGFVLKTKFGIDLIPVIWPENESTGNGLLKRSLYSQTAIFSVEYALSRLWESWGIKPDIVLGHSLGEFGAAVCAGIMGLEDALTLVAERSRLIEAQKPGNMLVIKGNLETVEKMQTKFFQQMKNGWMDIAAINSADQTVVAGPCDVVAKFSEFLGQMGTKCTLLEATNAFHSRDMDPMLKEYERIAARILYRSPKEGIEYVSGLLGKAVSTINAEYWLKHTREAVRFKDASIAAWNLECRIFLEIGPQPVLTALAMANVSNFGEEVTLLPSIRRKENEWTTLLTTLSKLYVGGLLPDWNGFDEYYERNKVSLPFYPFNRKNYWYTQGRGEGSEGVLTTFSSGNVLHPLLGHAFPNATSIKIYQGSVNPDKFPYLKDHCIGEKVIFPGAGYLEMSIAAGNASTSIQLDGERVHMCANPVVVGNLMIHSPLGLDSTVHLQTTVDVSSTADMDITIHTLRKGKWVKMTTATFSPLPMTYAPEEGLVSKDSLDTILQRMTPAEVEINDFYERLKDVGLQFGPTFRSIKQVWKGGEKEILCEVGVPPESTEYLIHPVVLDAMIQSILIGLGHQMESLYVPLSIGKVVVFAPLGDASSKLYAHCHWADDAPDSRCAVLYDEAGKILALMTGVQMIETSVLQILKALDHQKHVLPGMYEEAWRGKTGLWKNRTNMRGMYREYTYSQQCADYLFLNNRLTETQRKFKLLREELVFCYCLRALYDMCWVVPKVGSIVELETLQNLLGVIKSYQRLLLRVLGIVTDEGLLTRISSTKWKIVKQFPQESQVHQRLREVRAELSKDRKDDLDIEPDDVRVMCACGEQLGKIMQGKASALPILFPDDKTCDTSAELWYNTTPILLQGAYVLLREILTEFLKGWVELPEEERGVMRILEIGAGTGSFTKPFLQVFEDFGVRYHYTYTDISPAFFIKARQIFETYGKKIVFKTLNIEEDAMSQGFVPGSYDMIFAANVLHAVKDLEEAVRNVRPLLRESGAFSTIEQFSPNRDIDIVFGVLEGYWKFTDTHLRPEHPSLSGDLWSDLFSKTGHSEVRSFYSYDYEGGGTLARASDIAPLYKPLQERVWLLFGTPEHCDRHLVPHFIQGGRQTLMVTKGDAWRIGEQGCITIRPSSKADIVALFEYMKEQGINVEGIMYLWGLESKEASDPLQVAQPFLYLAQSLLEESRASRLIVVTEGLIPIGDQTPAEDVTQGVLWGMTRSFRSENQAMFVRSVDLDPDEQDLELKYKELAVEVWNDDSDFQVAYRQRSRHVARFVPNKDLYQALSLPSSGRFCLVLPKTRNIADLTYTASGRPTLKDGEVEVQVKCVGLNFRDVFVVLKPDPVFEKYNTVGFEFAGVIVAVGPNVTRTKLGDNVIGCNFTGDALPSHAVCNSDNLIIMPEGMTYHEATTLPAAFATAYFCLVETAKLKKGETVLIHAGSGGVGLFAIQVAQHLGAEIIATAGSRRKRTYLRSLGIKHVFHSRNTDYGQQIMEVTKGKGVHVVLNCLTSPGFKEASLGACAKGARFIEISKQAIWSEEEVVQLRPDVGYWIVDVSAVSPETWDSMFDQLEGFCRKGFIKPTPYVAFDAPYIREALLYMQKAKHIGKVLITMPEAKEGNQTELKIHMFNSFSTYLITGGLGGIGLEVAKWMTDNGAQHIVLVSRREPTERAVKVIAEMEGKGKNIVVRSMDVGNYEEMRELIGQIEGGELGLPPLRGVMHCAGCLADAIYPNQTMDTFYTSFRGKVYGAWNLHRSTVELDCRLEHFVLYSSIVSIFGPIGLSNYAGGNTYLDALAHYRNAIGLTAQTINWGQWAEVGAAANINITAIRAFTPSQGIAGLEAIMKSHKPQSCILEVDFASLKKLTGHAAAYLEEIKISKDSDSITFSVKMERFWDEYNAASDDDQKIDVLKMYIEIILRQILKFDEDEPIDENQNFSDMGMDSLMMLEMKNQMQTMLGKGITMNVSAMQELTTVAKLVAHLKEMIENMNDEEQRSPADFDVFPEEVIALINKDMVLPEHLKAKPDMQPSIQRSQVSTVLLTGATGKWGPFMLKSLLKRPNLKKVLALVRKQGKEKPIERLRKALESIGMDKELDLSRVEVIDGDVTEKQFGLTQSQWEDLVSSTEAVVHCAVKGNLMSGYTRMGKDGKLITRGTDIRTVNVVGTLNVMELCIAGPRPKPLYFASTLLANQETNKATKTMWEDWYKPENVFNLKNTGYPVSKYVCEVLLKQFSETGVPVGVYRLPALFGDSETGQFVLANNHAMIRLLGFCKLGTMPAIPLPIQLLPSDTAADITLDVFFRDDTPLGVYNVANPHPCVFADIPKISKKVGFPIELVEWDVFAERLKGNEDYKTLFPNTEVDLEEGRYVDFSTSPKALKAWIENPDGYFMSQRLLSIFPDLKSKIESPLETLKRDLKFALESGICAKFGIKAFPPIDDDEEESEEQ